MISGKVDAARALQSLNFQYTSRSGNVLISPTSISFDSNGNFNYNLPNLTEDVGKIILKATTINIIR